MNAMNEENQREPYRRGPGNHVAVKRTRATKNSPLVNAIVNRQPSDTDPQGMYTGLPLNEDERPVQDADDL